MSFVFCFICCVVAFVCFLFVLRGESAFWKGIVVAYSSVLVCEMLSSRFSLLLNSVGVCVSEAYRSFVPVLHFFKNQF